MSGDAPDFDELRNEAELRADLVLYGTCYVDSLGRRIDPWSVSEQRPFDAYRGPCPNFHYDPQCTCRHCRGVCLCTRADTSFVGASNDDSEAGVG